MKFTHIPGLSRILVLSLLLALALFFALPAPVAATENEKSQDLYFNTRNIEIAVEHLDAGAAPVNHYELWYTLDDGKTWMMEDDPYPGRSPLQYTAVSDGRYGFRVLAVDGSGKKGAQPQSGDAPDVICVIDTIAPRLEVRAPRDGEAIYAGSPVVLEWQVSDENLPENPMTIEYRRAPGQPWETVRQDELFGSAGKMQWYTPFVDGTIEIRMRAADRSANERIWSTEEPLAFLPYTGFRGSRGIAADPYTSFRRFPVFYRLTRMTSVELANVEIWYRPELGEWQLVNDPDRKSPYILEVPEDGCYALYLRMIGHNGVGDRPAPGPDTPADSQVIVDTLSPQGTLTIDEGIDREYHRAGEAIHLAWKLDDGNLHASSCALELSLDGGATWNRLTGQLSMAGGEGAFDWRPPLIEAEAMQFRLVARDLAENTSFIDAPTRVFLINPRLDGEKTSREHHRRAVLLVQRGDRPSLASAIERLEVAINYDPKNAGAWHDRGVVHTLLGDHTEALLDYQKAHELAPGDLGFTFSLIKGLLNLHHKGSNAASEYFQSARSLFTSISKVEVYKQDDYQTLLATYRVLESTLGSDPE